MRLKQRPEDFSVKESYRFDEAQDGPWRVYLMDKQKLSTFEAVARLQTRFGLKPGSITYCGLKDKQGRTEQLIAVDGHDVEMQDPDLRLKYLGRSLGPLSAANITSNRFAVTVRHVRTSEVQQLTIAAAEVNRLGVVNYFDSQRFGSLKHGQGFIAKDLIRGDFEAALHNYLAVPSPLDRTDDAKVKAFWAQHWGDWTARCPFEAARKYQRIFKALREDPTDFVTAFLQIDSDYRALILFTYQSYLWNETARRLLQLLLPREHLFPMPYQAGTLLHHRDADPQTLHFLKTATVPLLAPNSPSAHPRVQEAVDWVLGREKLKLEQLRIEQAPRLLYFRHEERKLIVVPQKLVVGRPRPDELNREFTKVNIAFTLPPGSYATLVVKRLFHFGLEEDDHVPGDAPPRQAQRPAGAERAQQRPRPGSGRAQPASGRPQRSGPPPARPAEGGRPVPRRTFSVPPKVHTRPTRGQGNRRKSDD